MLKKPVFEKGNVNLKPEMPPVFKQYNNTIHYIIKKTPVQASKKSNEKEVCSNLKDEREIQESKFNLGQLVRTADIEKVISKGDSTNYSYKLHTVTEVLHNTILSYRLSYLTERYNENLLLPPNLTLDENNQVMKKLNLIHYCNKW